MAIEVIEVQGVEQTSSGNGYKVKWNGRGSLFCFDPKTSKSLLESVGKTISVDVDRTPNAEGKVFAKIMSFHGEADAAAGPSLPAAPASNATPQASGPRGGWDFKKDPVGLVVGTRQTALNAAINLAAHGQLPPGDVVTAAQGYAEFLISGLSAHIIRDGVEVSHVLPWNQKARAAANATARAELEAAVPPPAAATQADDDIPF